MKIHHLNCGTMRPVGGRLLDGASDGLSAHLVCHCLLIETSRGLVLVDTGFGLNDVAAPARRLNGLFRKILRPELVREQTAWHQIQRMGFMPEDVKHIILTHLDFDHAGGLDDFPEAEIHLLEIERLSAVRREGFVGSRRYSQRQFGTRNRWRTYQLGAGSRWFGFESVNELHGLPPEILMVPLPGHTWGHTAVAVETDSHWLLHCGDAYFYRGEMNVGRSACTPGLRLYQQLMEVDREQRLGNQERLRELLRRRPADVRTISSHDPVEFAALERESLRRQPQTSLRRP